ncbi:MAG TPA: multiheme c-type cytochrome [Polyangiaceae bacterium]|nr:multiheme c-type cytochrome [Polyangiaceae bacterium]
MTKLTPVLLVACFLGACVAMGGSVGCKRNQPPVASPSSNPTLRIYAISTLAGALEPCGCVKNMLGGVDHAAALLAKGKQQAPHSLFLAAGPLWFMDPTLKPERQTQDVWKAESIADAMADMGLQAWTPGANDFAAGADTLKQLQQRSGARLLAANVKVAGSQWPATAVLDVAGMKVGVAGVTQLKPVAGVTVGDPRSALSGALQEINKQKADIKVALLAADRGEALRWIEGLPGFDVVLIGKPSDQGEGNDATMAPVLVGDALVVQAPNHLQAVAMIDLFVTGDYGRFADGTGLERAEQRQSLERRIAELERRLAQLQGKSDIKAADLAARKGDLERLRDELRGLSGPVTPPQGSFFRYEVSQVREELGTTAKVTERMGTYYKRVNDQNREAFKDRRPPALEPGQAHYVGMEECADCHEEADEFWRKTGHAKAYQTLAKEFKEFNLDCVGCHVTGYEQPGGSTVTFVNNLKDVQCEQCHGPGSAHVDDSERKGLIQRTPPKDLCAKCHHPPHVHEDWSVDEAWKHIIGPGHGQTAAAPQK